VSVGEAFEATNAASGLLRVLVAGLVIRKAKPWSVDVITDTASPDFVVPGSTDVQVSMLYTTPDRTGNPVGTICSSCNLMLKAV
jgi:hypothetical protein